MKKLTKTIINELAKKLPEDYYPVRKPVSGSELFKRGVKKVGNEDVDPDEMYMVQSPNGAPVNHKRRLRKAYEKQGKEGLINYLVPKYIPPTNLDKLNVMLQGL